MFIPVAHLDNAFPTRHIPPDLINYSLLAAN